MITRRPLLAATAATLAAPVVRAQGAWPNGPIRIVVPFPPGGSTDAMARLLQPRLQAELGQPIIVENRGGASGSLGTAAVPPVTVNARGVPAASAPLQPPSAPRESSRRVGDTVV